MLQISTPQTVLQKVQVGVVILGLYIVSMLAHTLSVHTLYYLQTVTVSTTYFPPALKSLQAHKKGEERAVQKDDKSKKTNKTVQRK